MSGIEVKNYLRDLCRDFDDGRFTRRLRQLAVSTAIPASLLISCVGLYPEYGAPFDEPEVCNDGIDNDQDGLIDCDDTDSDCYNLEICLGCHDGLDNDGNEKADCRDDTCSSAESCLGSCDNEQDDDGDGAIDCDDPDCAGVDSCL